MKTSSSSRALRAATAVTVALILSAAQLQSQQGTPLSVGKIKDLLLNRVAPGRVLSLATTSCISFRVTAGVETELRAAGADAVLIAALRSVCYRSTEVKPPPPPVERNPPITTRREPRIPPPRTTPTLSRGAEIYGSLGPTDPSNTDGTRYDTWAFSARAGERLLLEAASSDFDVKVFVGTGVGTAFSEIANDDDSGEGLNSRLFFRVPSTREYTLRVQSYSTTVGRYSVKVSEAPPERMPQTYYATRGSALAGSFESADATLDDGKPYEHWRFNAQGGEQITFDLRSTDFDPYVSVGEMRGSEYSQLAYDDDGGEGINSLLTWTAPRSGEFIVRVQPYGSSTTGSYNLTIAGGATTTPATTAPQAGTPTWIFLAQNTECQALASTTSLPADRPVAAFYFQPNFSSGFTLTTENETPDPVMYVYSASGGGWSLTGNDDDSGEGLRPSLRLNAVGGQRYLVCLWSFGEASGTMVLRAIADGGTPGPGPATTPTVPGRASMLTRGVVASGALAPGDSLHRDGSLIDPWRFTGTAGERVRIRLTSTAFRPYFAYFSLDASGTATYIAGSTAGGAGITEAIFTLPRTGTYEVHANSHDGGNRPTGAYTIVVETVR